MIRRVDGSCFRIVPERTGGAPLDIPPLNIALKPGAALEDVSSVTKIIII
jgi:hypothetical protein